MCFHSQSLHFRSTATLKKKLEHLPALHHIHTLLNDDDDDDDVGKKAKLSQYEFVENVNTSGVKMNSQFQKMSFAQFPHMQHLCGGALKLMFYERGWIEC